MNKGLFITGTDTNVGKTLVACGIIRMLKSWKIKVGVMKPIATGDREDAKRLLAAAGIDEPLDVVNPQFFKAPLAPRVAASLEEREVNTDLIYRSFWYLYKKYEVLIVEGVGGVKVPVGDSTFVLDLIQALQLPALVVSRASLGTLNHSLLTLEALDQAHLPVAGVLMNGNTRKTLAERTNAEVLQECTTFEVLGELRSSETYQKDFAATSRALQKLPRLVRAVKRSIG